MEKAMTPAGFGYRKLVFLIPILLVALFITKCVADNVEQRRIDEEIATAQGLAKVVSETFRGKFQAKVATVSGIQDVTSVNHGIIFDTSQRALIPYSVDYFVDLSNVDQSDLLYNPATKELVVRVPDVNIAKPNIDETRIKILQRSGWFRSTKAGENLAVRASKLAEEGARKSASDPAKIKKARDYARDQTSRFLQLPLEKAGLKDVKVAVRFLGEGGADPSYIDLSTPYQEAIRQYHERQAAQGKK